MSSSLRRGALTATFVLSIATVTACGAGFDAETDQVGPMQAGVQVEDIKIQNVNVLLAEEEGGPAGVSARIFNDGTEDQTLLSITLPGSGEEMELIPAEGEDEIVIPARGSLALGGEGNAIAIIEDPQGAGIAAGNAQHLVFDLSTSGEAALYARVMPVVDFFDYYLDWAPPTLEEVEGEDEAGIDEDAIEGVEDVEEGLQEGEDNEEAPADRLPGEVEDDENDGSGED
ncbi:DUF461 domain-containing protein [Streptomyces alkaliphilus]|uniref:DUF461 domain-containing protein n=1 Tax=Streptomyces alkaliphilus TaxID=1472722 RepID=UPI0011802B97|nr:DUF461 domain-containing protein [Streptomyces alkaliphilus]MQS06257.1 DUF461 domain-containing protein [Streptomyces alkaliphilus]